MKAAKITELISTDATATTLLALLRENPSDQTNGALLYDRLQEIGVKPATAKRAVKQFTLDATPIQDWPQPELRRLLRGTSVAALEAALATVNGRRRERTVSLDDALRACARARKDGYAWCSGGTVANSYGYRATQTGFVVAVRSDGTLRIAARECNATKGSSVTNQVAGITARGTASDYRTWANADQVAFATVS